MQTKHIEDRANLFAAVGALLNRVNAAPSWAEIEAIWSIYEAAADFAWRSPQIGGRSAA